MPPGLTPGRAIVQTTSQSRRVDNQAGFFPVGRNPDPYADLSFCGWVDQEMIDGGGKRGVRPDEAFRIFECRLVRFGIAGLCGGIFFLGVNGRGDR